MPALALVPLLWLTSLALALALAMSVRLLEEKAQADLSAQMAMMQLDQASEVIRRIFFNIKCEDSGVEALQHRFPTGKIDQEKLLAKVPLALLPFSSCMRLIRLSRVVALGLAVLH